MVRQELFDLRKRVIHGGNRMEYIFHSKILRSLFIIFELLLVDSLEAKSRPCFKLIIAGPFFYGNTDVFLYQSLVGVLEWLSYIS